MPKIFYWTVDFRRAAGGEKHSYEHVDILNDAGFDAYALHMKGKRYTWFPNDTRVIHGADFWKIFDPREDYLVLPETIGEMTSAMPGKKVIFNKNLYIGCSAFELGAPVDSYPYTDPSVAAVFAVSDHNLRHLRYAFPAAKIFRLYAHIDPAVYRYRPLREKKPRIVVTKKARDPLAVLFTMLQARQLSGVSGIGKFEVTFLEGLSSQQAAAVLSDALMLVSLSTYEGLPRTVLEAMSCGCIVAAYGTGPLKEILPKEYAFEPDDLVAVAEHIETVTRAFPGGLDAWAPCIERARATAAEFSAGRQRTHLLEAWRAIFDANRTAAPAAEPAHLTTRG